MPLYEYQCSDCGQKFELLRRMDEPDENLRCPHCDSEHVERTVSTFSGGAADSGPSTCGGGSRFT